MKITVSKILLNDNHNLEKMTVLVTFYDDEGYFHKSADVTVFVDKTVTDLEQVKTLAIEEARAFLTSL